MYLYKFWTVSSGILNYYSWRICSSCFRDVEGGNLFLTPVSKTDQSGSMMFKSGDCAGQGHAFQTMTEQFQLCELSFWKTASSLGNNVWIMGCTWLPKPAHILPCSNLAMKCNNGTNRILYHNIAAKTITEPPLYHCWNSTWHSRL
jgi:hypothetical protein